MDELSQKKFDEIVKKEPFELNKENIAFLRARRSYLTPEQFEKFRVILEDKPKKDSKKAK